MKVIGITGGIGSGKSVVCGVFSVLGVPVYDADSEAKKLYDLAEVTEQVKKEFGKIYFSASGELDKKKFADFVFRDAAALKKINGIIHPFVKKNFNAWKKNHAGKPYVLKEAAILFESGTDKGCDKVIAVTAPAELRIQRVMSRDQRMRQQVEQIISKQMPDEEKIKRADFVLVNDETSLLLPEIQKLHERLMADAGKRN